MEDFLDDEFFLKLLRLGAKHLDLRKSAGEILLGRLHKERVAKRGKFDEDIIRINNGKDNP